MANRFAKFNVAPVATGEKPITEELTHDKRRQLEGSIKPPPRSDDAGFTIKIFLNEIGKKTFYEGKPLSQSIVGTLVLVNELVQPPPAILPVDRWLEPVLKEKIPTIVIDHAKKTITPQCFIRKSGAGRETKRHEMLFTPEQQAEHALSPGRTIYVSVPCEEWDVIKPTPMPGMTLTLANVTFTCGTKLPDKPKDTLKDAPAEDTSAFRYHLNASTAYVRMEGSPRLEDMVLAAFPLAEQQVPPILEILKNHMPGDPNHLAPFLFSVANVPPRDDDELWACQTVLPRNLPVEADDTVRGIFAEVRGYPQSYRNDAGAMRAVYTSINLLQFVDAPDGSGKAKELYTIPQIEVYPENMLGFGLTAPHALDAVLRQHCVPFYVLYKPDLELTRNLTTNNGHCEARLRMHLHGALQGKTFSPFRIVPRIGEYCETHGIPVTRALVAARFTGAYKPVNAFGPSYTKAIADFSQDRDGKVRIPDRPYESVDNTSEIVFLDECGTLPDGAAWRFYAWNIDDYKTQPRRRPHEDPDTVQRIDMTPAEGTAFVLQEIGIPEEKAGSLSAWVRTSQDKLPRYIFWAVRQLSARELASRTPVAPRSLKRAASEMDPDAIKDEADAAGAEPNTKQAKVEPELFDEESQQPQF